MSKKRLPPEPLGPLQSFFLCSTKGRKTLPQEGDEVIFVWGKIKSPELCDIKFERHNPAARDLYVAKRLKGKRRLVHEPIQIRLRTEDVNAIISIISAFTGLNVALHTRMFGGKILVFKLLARR